MEDRLSKLERKVEELEKRIKILETGHTHLTETGQGVGTPILP